MSRDLENQRSSRSISGEETDVDLVVVDGPDGTTAVELNWDSPDDPDNPTNWPVSKKVFQTATPALYCFALAIGSSTYVPAIPRIELEFGVSRTVAILPLSLYIFGYVFGPLIAAPMCEIYGRRNVYWATMPQLFIFNAIAGASNNMPLLVIARFLAGVGGSGPFAIAAATVSDIWTDKKQVGRAAVGFALAPFLGPALGYLTGAYIIAQYDDWRYSIWVILMIGAPIAIMACFMKETAKFRILFLREQKRGAKAKHQKGDTKVLLIKLRKAIARPVKMMFTESFVAALSIYTGFAFAMMFSFFASYTYVFQTVYGFNQKETGLAFLGILVGFLLGVVVFAVIDAKIYNKAITEDPNGRPTPELRLYPGMVGSVLLPISLFWFAWAPNKDVHWIAAVLAGVPFGIACLSAFMSSTTYQIDVYGVYNASALAANGIIRYTLGASFPLFTLQMYDALGVGWAGSVFAFVGLAVLPVPWVFFKWGPLLRKRSPYAAAVAQKSG